MKNGPLKSLLSGKKHPTDLIFTITFSLISAASTLIFPDGSALRILLALPLMLFFPGYAMISMMWPAKSYEIKDSANIGKKEKIPDVPERLMFSVGLSLVLIAIAGLILNYVSSITLFPILISLLAITLTFSLVAWHLRYRLSAEERFRLSFLFVPKTKSTISDGSGIFTVILVCGILLTASVLGYMIVNPVDNGSYSKFYLLDRYHTLESLPCNLSINETGTVIITIHNLEDRPVNYSVVASVEKNANSTTFVEPVNQIELSIDQYTVTNVTLNDMKIFELEYRFHFSEPGRYKIVWNLFMDGLETEYQLHLLVNVT